jgi:hypothetical protein
VEQHEAGGAESYPATEHPISEYGEEYDRGNAAGHPQEKEDGLRAPEVQPRQKTHLHYEERVAGRLRLADAHIKVPDGVGQIHVVESH